MPHNNKSKFDENFDSIDWTKKYPKKFCTSWGAEYTIWLPVNKKEEDWKHYNSPTIQSTIKSKTSKKTQ